MQNPLTQKSWSPYAVGAGIGVLSWFAFWSANHPLGISTAFEHTAALLLSAVWPELSESNVYFQDKSPKIGWQWMLVVGVFLGSLGSATLSGDREPKSVPSLWSRRFGSGLGLRMIAAFSGAALMLFGARFAGGCTSGHGISGTLQLASSSWLFTAILFIAGIGTSFALYSSERDHV